MRFAAEVRPLQLLVVQACARLQRASSHGLPADGPARRDGAVHRVARARHHVHARARDERETVGIRVASTYGSGKSVHRSSCSASVSSSESGSSESSRHG